MIDVDREDILLLILDANRRIGGHEKFKGITRLEKLIFLLAKDRDCTVVDKLFDFKAYKFGPFSKDVYEASEFLRGINFVSVDERPVMSHYATTEEELLTEDTSDEELSPIAAHEKVFTLTPEGKKVAEKLREIWQLERPADLARVDDVLRRFGMLPLNQLIRYVYRRFPEMAAKSVHPEAGVILKK